MTQWQPIETAPKDGTVVLACEIDYYPESVASANFESGSWWWHMEGSRATPTHWQPLPPPPTTEQ
jgi:hypothetical protein